jgi:hypothetical protein
VFQSPRLMSPLSHLPNPTENVRVPESIGGKKRVLDADVAPNGWSLGFGALAKNPCPPKFCDYITLRPVTFHRSTSSCSKCFYSGLSSSTAVAIPTITISNLWTEPKFPSQYCASWTLQPRIGYGIPNPSAGNQFAAPRFLP